MSSPVESLVNREYKWGFVTDIEADTIPKGLSEDIIRLISAKKQEPEFLLEWRLKAFRGWLKMVEPHWPNVHYPPIDYQDLIYYSAPKTKQPLGSLDEVDPKLLETLQCRRTISTGSKILDSRLAVCEGGHDRRAVRYGFVPRERDLAAQGSGWSYQHIGIF